jgi:hypothetical protein
VAGGAVLLEELFGVGISAQHDERRDHGPE